MRTGAVATLIATLIFAACSNTAAPTPIVIFVTPPPTLTQPSGGVILGASPTGSVAPSESAAPGASASSAAPSSSASPSESTPPSESASVGPTESPQPSVSPSASPTIAPPECATEPPTSLSAGWATQASHTSDFSFGRPKGWADHKGLGALTYGNILDAQTLTDSGLDASTSQSPDIMGGPGATGAGLPNLRIFAIPGVKVALEVVRGRLAQFYANAQGNVLGRTDVTGCLAGSSALGFDVTYNNGNSYYQLLIASHNDTLYVLEWVATTAAPAKDVLAEIVRSWQWMGEAAVVTPQPSVGASLAPGTPAPTRTLKPGETPASTPIDIGAFLVAQIGILHLGDQTIHLAIAISDASTGKTSQIEEFDLEATDTATQSVVEDTYAVTFTRPGSSAAPITCTFVVKKGDDWEFVSTDETVAVLNAAHPPVTRADLVVGTSPLCRQPAP